MDRWSGDPHPLLDGDHMPPVKAVMTPFPWAVEIDASLAEAEAIMREHGVRHVPVQSGDALVGVLTDRDVANRVNPALPADERRRLSVRQVCSRADLYVVETGAPLDAVLAEMAERHLGSALVVHHGRLAGIFTTTDACRALAELLRARHASGPDEAA